MNDTVHLKLAFWWSCLKCKRANAFRPAQPPRAELEQHIRAEMGLLEWEELPEGLVDRLLSTGNAYFPPAEVCCRHCKTEFFVDQKCLPGEGADPEAPEQDDQEG